MFTLLYAIWGVFGDREGVARALRRVVVANNFRPPIALTWVKHLGIPYDIVKPEIATTHNIGEAYAYMQWIVENYDKLPEYTVFLSDAGPHHWHVVQSWYPLVKSAQPRCYEASGTSLPEKWRRCYLVDCLHDEWPCMRNILSAFNLTFDRKQIDLVQGNEFVLADKAVRSHPKNEYQHMIAMMRDKSNSCSSQKWGYALDRLKRLIWHNCN